MRNQDIRKCSTNEGQRVRCMRSRDPVVLLLEAQSSELALLLDWDRPRLRCSYAALEK